jgi:thiamine biosynthesis protein ThiI
VKADDSDGSGAVLVAFGEVGTKSAPVRRRMLDALAGHCRALLDDRGVRGDVEAGWDRVLVRTPEPDAAAAAVSDAFGAVWARPARTCEPAREAVEGTLRALAVAHDPGGAETFAVRAGATGDAPFGGRELERAGGAAVESATGASVDLDDPDRTYRVEVRDGEAFVAARSLEGPGGLPFGTQGRVVALVSGGIDSPVAAYEVMRRGCEVVPAFVDLGAYGGVDHEARAVETVRRLARHAPHADLRVRVLPAGPLVETLVDAVGATRMLSLRRAMLAAAGAVAERVDAHAVVTGESLGQKSSQTGPNLAVTDAAVDRPVHRPLLTRDKTDVEARARAVGTYRDSTLPAGCERVAPPHPETNASLAAVRAAEPDDLLARARALVDEARVVEF